MELPDNSSLEQIRAFLKETGKVQFQARDRPEGHAWIEVRHRLQPARQTQNCVPLRSLREIHKSSSKASVDPQPT